MMFLLLTFIRLPRSSKAREAERRDSFVLRGDEDDANPEQEPLLDGA